MPSDLGPWAEFGLPGLIIAALIGFVFFLMKEHRAERTEWKQDSRADRKDNIDALNRLTDAMHAVESAVKDKR